MLFKKIFFSGAILGGGLYIGPKLCPLHATVINPEDLCLDAVIVFCRHGARTPVRFTTFKNIAEPTFDISLMSVLPHTAIENLRVILPDGSTPTPSYHDETYYKTHFFKGGCMMGQLTTVGQQQTFDLGERLRNDYAGRLISGQDLSQVFIRCTNLYRNIDSARCIAAGIFGAGFLNKIGHVLTLNTERAENERIYPDSYFCKAFKDIRMTNYDFWETFFQRQDDWLNIANYLGLDEASSIVYTRDELLCRQAHGQPVPPEPILSHQLQYLDHLSTEIEKNSTFPADYDRQFILAFSAAPLLSWILSDVNSVISKEIHTKMFLYVGHDTTLIPILVSMGIFDDKWPVFAADVRFELFCTRAKEYFIRIKYCDKVLRFPGIESDYCPWERFRAFLEAHSVTPEEYEALCAGKLLRN